MKKLFLLVMILTIFVSGCGLAQQLIEGPIPPGSDPRCEKILEIIKWKSPQYVAEKLGNPVDSYITYGEQHKAIINQYMYEDLEVTVRFTDNPPTAGGLDFKCKGGQGVGNIDNEAIYQALLSKATAIEFRKSTPSDVLRILGTEPGVKDKKHVFKFTMTEGNVGNNPCNWSDACGQANAGEEFLFYQLDNANVRVFFLNGVAERWLTIVGSVRNRYHKDGKIHYFGDIVNLITKHPK